MKRAMVLLFVVVAVAGVLVVKHSQRTEPEGLRCSTCSLTATVPPGAPQGTNACNVPAPAGRSVPKLLDLGSVGCIPCRTMAPMLDELKATFAERLDVVFIDVRKDPAAGERYGVRLIPTQIFFDADGRELSRHEGYYGREEILATWRELGYAFEEAE
jgi:thioredoxin 1